MMSAYTLWLLPDDGIIDPVAVEIAANGTRRVRLTAPERRAAAALILARGGTAYEVAWRLCMSGHTAKELAANVRADAAAPVELGEVA
jgi:hypothetical protein